MAWWIWVLIIYFGMNTVLAIIHLVMAFIDVGWAGFWARFPIQAIETVCLLFIGFPLALYLLFEG